MGAFLLLNDRQQKVRWFMDQVTELKARFPKLQHIHFIGHSNGTYVLASALQNYRTLRVERVVFAGSVVRRDFPWSQFRGRVKGVRNYVGSADWVVGFFPKLFELPWLAALNPDLGSAGYDGFEDGFVKDDETQFIRGEHSAALVESNVQSVVDFVLEGKKTDVPALVATEHPRLLDLCSRLCWLVWLVIILMVLALGRLVTLFFSGRLVRWSPRGKGRLALAIYCLIVLALLYTL
jgi:pimeloyl-ACP methyl ester carboxylesterase